MGDQADPKFQSLRLSKTFYRTMLETGQDVHLVIRAHRLRLAFRDPSLWLD